MALALDNQVSIKGMLPLASGLELMQTALLIQDDIMDGDTFRRGQKTLHFGLAEQFSTNKIVAADKLAEHVAYCMSDVLFFGIFNELNQATLPNKEQAVADFMTSFIEVGFGQARDVYMGGGGTYTAAEVMEMYGMKTSSYIFCLPLKLAARSVGASEETIRQVDELGRVLGIMFQAKDDVLNIFGEQLVTGKSVGSDVAENKQTLIRGIISELAVNNLKAKKLLRYFGKPLTKTKFDEFYSLASELQIKQRAEQVVLDQHQEFEQLISKATLPTQAITLLKEVELFLITREK